MQTTITMQKRWLYSVCIMVMGLRLWAAFPTDQEALGLLKTVPSFLEANETAQTEKLSKLSQALKFAYSVKANEAFWAYLNRTWDTGYDLSKKQSILEQAKATAILEAEKYLNDLKSRKSESGKFRLSEVLHLAMPSNPATELFYERDRFVGVDGNLDFRTADFARDTHLPIEKRGEVDLVSWADSRFIGTPEKRLADLKQLQERALTQHGQYSTDYSKCNISPALGACGTPSSQAPAIRPESHGWR